jgi:hypothetical protein
MPARKRHGESLMLIAPQTAAQNSAAVSLFRMMQWIHDAGGDYSGYLLEPAIFLSIHYSPPRVVQGLTGKLGPVYGCDLTAM